MAGDIIVSKGIQWFIIHPTPLQSIFRMSMDKETCVHLMQGLYRQVNDPKINTCQWDLNIEGFLDLYEPKKLAKIKKQ